MALTVITVTATEHDPTNAPAVGTIAFELTSALRDPSGNIIVEPVPIERTLDGSGTLGAGVGLIATDSSGVLPASNVAYKVTKRLTGLTRVTYILVPAASSGGTLDLADAEIVNDPASLGIPAFIIRGHGSPEGVIAAPMGMLYENLDGDGTLLSGIKALYVKASGGLSNTGWRAI